MYEHKYRILKYYKGSETNRVSARSSGKKRVGRKKKWEKKGI